MTDGYLNNNVTKAHYNVLSKKNSKHILPIDDNCLEEGRKTTRIIV